MAKNVRRTQCTCTRPTEVFPKPPCDVFRAADTGRTKLIEEAWDACREDYVWNFGDPLYDKFHFLDIMISCHPADEQKKIRGAAKMHKGERKTDPWGKLWNKYNVESEQVARINHLVPKEAGGCPTGPGNLQPQQLMCHVCQDIDQMMTDHWQG